MSATTPANSPTPAQPVPTPAAPTQAQPVTSSKTSIPMRWPSAETWGTVLKDAAVVVAGLSYLATNGTSLGVPQNVVTYLAGLAYILGHLVRAFNDDSTN